MVKSEKQSASQANTNPAIKSNHEMLQASNNLHDYVKTDLDAISDGFMLCEEEFPALLDTPCKSPNYGGLSDLTLLTYSHNLEHFLN